MNEKSHIPHPFELFGVECHKGWFELLKPIFSYVQEYNKDKNEEEQIKFLQIKEKWGSLDIYTNFSTFKLTKLIEEAEEKADHTCEECGSTENIGVRLNGWVTTMCFECVKKEATESGYPQLWERNSDNKRFWIFPNDKVEEIEDITEENDNLQDNPYLLFEDNIV